MLITQIPLGGPEHVSSTEMIKMHGDFQNLKLKAKYHLRVFGVIVKVISYWILKGLWFGTV